VKTYYDLLQVEPDASPAQIKQAFRHLIARYHPDKVQHLGDEFQALAETRSAELTIAYKTLADPAERDAYDRRLAAGAETPEEPAPPPPAPVTPPEPPVPPQEEDVGWRHAHDDLRAGRDAVLKRAALAKVEHLFSQAFTASERPDAPGFDISCLSKPRLFERRARSWLLAKFVPRLSAEAVQEVWTRALCSASTRKATLSVFLLAGDIPSKHAVADALAANHRRATSGQPGVTILPVDVRDWRTWIPADADPVAKALAARLQRG